jgi:hypothetical protein
MKLDNLRIPIAVLVILVWIPCAVQAQSSHYDELANLPFPGAYPTKAAADTLKDELAFQRAVQAYLWSLPAMNIYAMREGQRNAFGDATGNRGSQPDSGSEGEVSRVSQPDEQQPDEAVVWKDKYVRLFADLENTKKRLARSSAQEVEAEMEALLRDVLPVADGYLYDHHIKAQQKAHDEAYEQGYKAGQKSQ